jgi:hypothetical protein
VERVASRRWEKNAALPPDIFASLAHSSLSASGRSFGTFLCQIHFVNFSMERAAGESTQVILQESIR